MLEEINEVLEITEKTGSQPGDTMPRGGLLSKKALSDLDAAKYDSNPAIMFFHIIILYRRLTLTKIYLKS